MRTMLHGLAAVLLGLAACTLQAAPFAYIPHDNGVAVIDVASRTRVTDIPISGADDVAVRPGDARAYIVDSVVRVIDTGTQREVLQLPSNDGYFMALSPAQRV